MRTRKEAGPRILSTGNPKPSRRTNLQSFAEAHVVAQDAMKFVAAQKVHPVNTGLLVAAQLSFDGHWHQESLQLAVVQQLL